MRQDGRDMLRVLLGEGITITKRPDGSFGLAPSELVTSDLLELARQAKPQITAIVAGLPAPDRCGVCGDPTGWNDRKLLARCVACAQVAADRVLAGLDAEPRFRDDIAQEGISHAA